MLPAVIICGQLLTFEGQPRLVEWEIRRHTDIVGVFLNDDAVLRNELLVPELDREGVGAGVARRRHSVRGRVTRGRRDGQASGTASSRSFRSRRPDCGASDGAVGTNPNVGLRRRRSLKGCRYASGTEQ